MCGDGGGGEGEKEREIEREIVAKLIVPAFPKYKSYINDYTITRPTNYLV